MCTVSDFISKPFHSIYNAPVNRLNDWLDITVSNMTQKYRRATVLLHSRTIMHVTALLTDSVSYGMFLLNEVLIVV